MLMSLSDWIYSKSCKFHADITHGMENFYEVYLVQAVLSDPDN